MKINIRWMIARDLDAVVAVEQASVRGGWTADDFLAALGQRNCIGMVAEHAHRIVGLMVYELHKDRLRLLNLAVSPAFRRRGVGRAMVQRLRDKLHQQRRTEIVLAVRESNLPAQLFFRACGFCATDVWREWYEDTGEDAYEMGFLLDTEPQPAMR